MSKHRARARSPQAQTVWRPSGGMMMRTPLLPFDTVVALGDGLRAAAVATAVGDVELAAALDEDERSVTASLRSWVTDPVVREALLCASPSLDEAISSWLAGGSAGRAAGVVPIVVRYLFRMATRSTPFGLFSGCSAGATHGDVAVMASAGAGTISRADAEATRLDASPRRIPAPPISRREVAGGDAPPSGHAVDARPARASDPSPRQRAAQPEIGAELSLPPRGDWVRRTRLDVHYLSLLAAALEREPTIRAALRWRPSTGLHRTPLEVRYAEAHIEGESRNRTYQLVSVARTEALDAALARAAGGASLGDVADAIAATDAEVGSSEARAFADALVDSQLLVSDLEPRVTGREPVHGMIDALERAGAAAAAAHLRRAVGQLRALDERGVGAPLDGYRVVAETLRALPAAVTPARLFQVDLYKPAPGLTLSGAPLQAVVDAAALWRHFARQVPDDALTRFRAAFQQRYEQREVPLGEALDEERGLGFGGTGGEPSPLLDDLALPRAASGANSAPPRATTHLVRRFAALLRAGARVWELDDADLRALGREVPAPLPDSFALMVCFASASPAAFAAGELSLTARVVSPAAALLGRFCHGDAGVLQATLAQLRAEERLRPHARHAEIVHLPDGRLGNVICRPLLGRWEIPFLGASGAPEDDCIGVEDLLVSVVGERVRLRCRRSGAEVVPRMTNAHNHGGATLGVYRFLCALETQDERYTYAFDWGPLSGAAFLPRVRRGQHVLALATWTLTEDELSPCQQGGRAQRFRAVQRLRATLQLPRWITFAQADNVLAVDLDNVLSVESFLALVRKRQSLAVRELFPAPDELCVTAEDGTYAHELVIPFVAERPASEALASAPLSTRCAAPPRRSFSPGGEWLYVKLYVGSSTLESLLADLTPALGAARQAGDIEGWFFLRYGDPDWHLRLRLRGPPEALWQRVFPALHRAWLPAAADGRLRRWALDTYDREVERYGGGRGIELAERIFEADSEAVQALLPALRGEEGREVRWRAAALGAHALLQDLELKGGAVTLLEAMAQRFAAEHQTGVPAARALGAKYRAWRGQLDVLLEGEELGPDFPGRHGLLSARAAFGKRSAVVRRAAADLHRLAAAGELQQSLEDIAAALLHMHLNRMFVADARAQELVIYDLLARWHRSKVARRRAAT